jgi:SHS2 domain-containing protein
MSTSHSKGSIFNNPPSDDQGSEAAYGFDYQAHCIARLCLKMLGSRDILETVCEFHEDLSQVRDNNSLRLGQVKKRESAEVWTIDLIKDAIEKLFKKMQYKDVSELVIYGSGRPSTKGDCSLAGLITLLDRPLAERDRDWHSGIAKYEKHLNGILNSDITSDIIKKGLLLLRIDLTLPHSEAIESENIKLTSEIIKQVWGVSVTVLQAEKAYKALYEVVWKASKKPKQPRTEKRITVSQARNIVRNILEQESYLFEDAQTLLDLNGKLEKGKLKQYLTYAIQRRMDARQIKFEYDINSVEWQNLKDEIATQWDAAQLQQWAKNQGITLWSGLRRLLDQIGKDWATQKNNDAYGPIFTEGLFFDMMAVCEVTLELNYA